MMDVELLFTHNLIRQTHIDLGSLRIQLQLCAHPGSGNPTVSSWTSEVTLPVSSSDRAPTLHEAYLPVRDSADGATRGKLLLFFVDTLSKVIGFSFILCHLPYFQGIVMDGQVPMEGF